MTVGMLIEELKKYDKSCRVLIYNEELEDCKESYYVKSIDELKNNEVLLVEEGYTEVKDIIPEEISKEKGSLYHIMTNYYDHPVFLVLKAKKDANIDNDIECSVHDIKCKLYEFAKSLLDKGYTMEDLYKILDEESYKAIKKLLS